MEDVGQGRIITEFSSNEGKWLKDGAVYGIN